MMELDEVIGRQIDAAIAALIQVRGQLGGDLCAARSAQVERHLQTASFHLEDLSYNWRALAGRRQERLTPRRTT